MPDRFLRKEAARLGLALPPARHYGAGLVFLPQRGGPPRAEIEALFARIVAEEGQLLLGWRDVPTDDSGLGPSAVAAEPVFRQLFIGRGDAEGRADADLCFERKLYVIRKRSSTRSTRCSSPTGSVVLRRQPVVADADLQGDADRQPD